MSDIMKIIESFKEPCPCGKEHYTAIRDIHIGSGLVHEVGAILKKNDFPKKLLLVADKQTLAAARKIYSMMTSLFRIYSVGVTGGGGSVGRVVPV